MTHAMVISAVHIDPATGRPTRYKVENSWGPTAGDKGYFVMSDAWFEECVCRRAFSPVQLTTMVFVQVRVPGGRAEAVSRQGSVEGVPGQGQGRAAAVGPHGALFSNESDCCCSSLGYRGLLHETRFRPVVWSRAALYERKFLGLYLSMTW